MIHNTVCNKQFNYEVKVDTAPSSESWQSYKEGKRYHIDTDR